MSLLVTQGEKGGGEGMVEREVRDCYEEKGEGAEEKRDG